MLTALATEVGTRSNNSARLVTSRVRACRPPFPTRYSRGPRGSTLRTTGTPTRTLAHRCDPCSSLGRTLGRAERSATSGTTVAVRHLTVASEEATTQRPTTKEGAATAPAKDATSSGSVATFPAPGAGTASAITPAAPKRVTSYQAVTASPGHTRTSTSPAAPNPYALRAIRFQASTKEEVWLVHVAQQRIPAVTTTLYRNHHDPHRSSVHRVVHPWSEPIPLRAVQWSYQTYPHWHTVLVDLTEHSKRSRDAHLA